MKKVTYERSVVARAKASIERCEGGDTLAAKNSLGDLWFDYRNCPLEARALVLLAVGMVKFWLAIEGQGDHENAKDLLSESVRLFAEDPLADKARIYLAAAYNRQGSTSEGMAILDGVLASTLEPDIKTCAATTKAIIETESGQCGIALKTLSTVRALIDKTSPGIRAKFHIQEGMAYRRLGQTDNALTAYTSSQYYFEVAGNRRFEAGVFNNLANVYADNGMFAEAIASCDASLRIFTDIRDDAHLAQAKDTKAEILLREGKAGQALMESTEAVRLLRGDDRCWLPSILITRANVLVRLKREHDAKEDLLRAVGIAEETGNLTEAGRAYLSMVEWLYLPVKERAEYYRRADDLSNDIDRLRACARKIISAIHPPRTKQDIEQERERIKSTLLANGRSVNKAAGALGLSGPGLARIIDHDPYLIPFRKTKRIRRTSLIKK